jgi:orotate phosphoribosyltransferase
MNMNEKLAKTIYDTCNLKGKFLLRSGKYSDEYFDKYLFESQPDILEAVARDLSLLIPKGTEILAGLEMGGIPVAVSLSAKTRLPVIFVRKKAKDYGTCKLAEGIPFAGKRVTVVEDVVTTGGAILDGVAALRAQGAIIDDVLCVIDRESGGTEKLAEQKLRLISLFKASQLRSAAGQPQKV